MGGITAKLPFTETPGGSSYVNREALNDHLYCCQADANVCATGEPPIDRKDFCKAFHTKKVAVRSDDAKRLGVPMIFTEFGACSQSEACFHEITSSTEEFDAHLASWAYWMFKGFGDFTTTGGLIEGMYDPEGNIQHFKLLALLRTFIHATQGTPLSNKFYTDATQNGTFVGTYQLDTTIQAPTEVYFSQDVYYPEGYKLSVLVNNAPSSSLQIDTSKRHYIKLFSNNSED